MIKKQKYEENVEKRLLDVLKSKISLCLNDL